MNWLKNELKKIKNGIVEMPAWFVLITGLYLIGSSLNNLFG